MTDYPPRKNHVDKAFRKFYGAVTNETVGRKSVDVDAWLKSLNESLALFNVSVQDEDRLRAQIDTFNQIRQNFELLSDLASPGLKPIRDIVDELSDKLLAADKPLLRRKIIFEFVNKLPIDKFTNFFPGVVFAKDIADRFPRAYKVYEVLVDEIFSVSIPLENFLSIMEKYFIIQTERNHTNHARADSGRFTTPDSLRSFMLDALDEIKAILHAD